jgi:hypothetical protein
MKAEEPDSPRRSQELLADFVVDMAIVGMQTPQGRTRSRAGALTILQSLNLRGDLRQTDVDLSQRESPWVFTQQNTKTRTLLGLRLRIRGRRGDGRGRRGLLRGRSGAVRGFVSVAAGD